MLFFSKLRQGIPEIRSERRDLLIFIFILKTTDTFTPVHSAGYLIFENSPIIIAASGADPAILKTGSQALVCQFLPNLYTIFY
jgi:hypothetical protein